MKKRTGAYASEGDGKTAQPLGSAKISEDGQQHQAGETGGSVESGCAESPPVLASFHRETPAANGQLKTGRWRRSSSRAKVSVGRRRLTCLLCCRFVYRHAVSRCRYGSYACMSLYRQHPP